MPAANYSPVARNLRAGSPVPGRPLIGAGLGLAASMLVLGAALLIPRTIYLNSVPASASADVAAAAFDILVRFIKTALRALCWRA